MQEAMGQTIRIVHDRRATAAMTTSTTTRNAALVNIWGQTEDMLSIAQNMNVHLVQIYAIQQTLHNSLQNVRAFQLNSRNVQFTATLVGDIWEHLDEIWRLAWENPALVTVARDVQLDVAERAMNLFGVASQVVRRGDTNLINEAQRLELLRYINNELRVMRGVVFAIKRQMQWAQRDGLNWSVVITGGAQQQIADRQQIANDVIRDIRRLRLN